MNKKNIYLIGLMGAGKTTVGRLLAKSLAVPFYDSDKAIEDITGVDIATIFEFEGEKGFRVRENKMINELTELEDIVLATGGGVILNADNRQRLQENGFVVYLQCSVDRILDRTSRNTQRPLLNVDSPREKIQSILDERESLYLSCADFVIDSGQIQSKAAVKEILKEYMSKVN
ncbi:shikimate kinase [Methylococcaceae bacterium HT1]|nr:shikimate kinase [Methyloprofundus sp.]TXK95908.1 shikimate kinase [Methylococcaceae bacterium CS5]TXK96026.1 shikimate kinase [Methylococcaceae bacterium CS4]TXK97948.1 shikimate kinase [Methylococcaceae bacterium HT1]TXL05446.1 shikimate kinase [Methylococcaceae bacterium CS1]TXL05853.1 shikimate kinase [Methylococcaceae bacterium CS3]TXL10215.1 shikimate kinase [Methylococcaceae bacterium CS2]TXL14390.1 shikimate kinase [Methylococcaceae bacterium HT4]TXL17402.1 shikimate kinase [Meth